MRRPNTPGPDFTFVEMKLRQQVMLFPSPYITSFHQPLTEPEPVPSRSYIVANSIAAAVGVVVCVVLITTTPAAALSVMALLP